MDGHEAAGRGPWRFMLPLSAGPAWFELPAPAAGLPADGSDGVLQALVLEPALALLAEVEAWLGEALPCPAPAGPAEQDRSTAGDGSVHLLELPLAADGALAGGRLALPWAALRKAGGSPPPAALQWPELPCLVCLQTLPAGRVAAAGIEPGALLLLPSSFVAGQAGPWCVQLQPQPPASLAAAVGACGLGPLPARWWPQDSLLHVGRASDAAQDLAEAVHDTPAAPLAWTVRLADPVRLGMQAWFGAAPVRLHAMAGPVELHLAGQPVARGRLLPCGRGHALRIEQRLDAGAATTTAAQAAWT